jgi:two-component system nitrate/nitrite sensor histidine kinase NarX
VARSLAGLNDQISTLGAAFGTIPDPAAQQLAGLQEQVNSEVIRTQQVIEELQAHPLDDIELVEAIHWRAETFALRHNVQVDFQTEGQSAALTAEQEIELYHMVDQALNHLAHHRDVHQVDLRLTCMGPMVALTIHDDGAGCHCADGVEHIETYAQLIGGHACIDSDGEHGNTFALWLPIKRTE